jgi:chemotaxis protein CheD
MKMSGIGGFGASNTPGDIIKTLALGSCVAVVLLHPVTRTVGMVHVALPDSHISPEKAQRSPGYFADTGIPALFRYMQSLGCDLTVRNYIVKLAGGARVMDPNGTFNIGQRNIQAITGLLQRYGLQAASQEVGGNISRTVTAHVDTGKVILSSSGRGEWEI